MFDEQADDVGRKVWKGRGGVFTRPVLPEQRMLPGIPKQTCPGLISVIFMSFIPKNHLGHFFIRPTPQTSEVG